MTEKNEKKPVKKPMYKMFLYNNPKEFVHRVKEEHIKIWEKIWNLNKYKSNNPDKF